MTNAYVTYGSLESAAAEIGTVKAELLGLLGEVQAEIDGLGSDFVTPTASATFHAMVDQFVTGMTKAFNGLDGLSKFLVASADTFTEVDKKLAGGIQGVGGGGGGGAGGGSGHHGAGSHHDAGHHGGGDRAGSVDEQLVAVGQGAGSPSSGFVQLAPGHHSDGSGGSAGGGGHHGNDTRIVEPGQEVGSDR